MHAVWISALGSGLHLCGVSLQLASAELWLERREELGFPLGQAAAPAAPPRRRGGGAGAAADAARRDLVVEIGCEELPPADATRQRRSSEWDPVLCAIKGRVRLCRACRRRLHWYLPAKWGADQGCERPWC